MRAQVKYGIIQRYASKYPVVSMCRFFDVSRSGYYSFRKRSKQSNRESLLVEQIQACRDNGKYMCTYGCRRVQLWVERPYGKHYNYKTVWRVMHKYGLLAKIRRKRFVHCGEETRTYANLLNRNFHADRPNQKWVTDISYIPTKQGTLYLSVIRDLFDLSIVAYKTSTRQSIKLVLDTVRLAMEKEEVTAELQLHSDQGFQYASQSYFTLTTQYGITPSMSRRANPYDNAMAENFFSILKSECIRLYKPETLHDAQMLIDEYIAFVKKNGYFEHKRQEQAKYWMLETINDQLKSHFYQNSEIVSLLQEKENRVLHSIQSPFTAAKEVLDFYFGKIL